MNLLLFLFAIPFAVIIFSIILQKIINSPILCALAVFSTFIIIAAETSNDTYFILAVIYSILSYITAILARLIKNIMDRCGSNNQNLIDLNNSIYTAAEAESDNSCYRKNKDEIIINKNNMSRKCWR